jgi:hypothetical protein
MMNWEKPFIVHHLWFSIFFGPWGKEKTQRRGAETNDERGTMNDELRKPFIVHHS